MSLFDRIEQLRADLARVTAEREAEFRRSDSELAAAAQKESALRARIAELESQIQPLVEREHFANGTADLAMHHRDIAEQRVAELEAALRDAVGMLEELDGLDWGEEGMPFDVDFSHFAKVLARAESATPLPMREDPRYRGTDFRSAIDVDRASQGGGK